MVDPNNILENNAVSLSVIIVARNEAKNIARTIESVLRAVELWPQTEIILVDSISTDETVEIAKCYPINIVRLKPSWFISASAGRLIGLHYTRGELVLHIDGDMELDSECVNRLVPYMLEHPIVGALGGYWRNVYIKDGQIVSEEDSHRWADDRPMEVKYVSGASLYRRSALLKMGGHQPFIRGEQDIYLCMGLRYSGYKIIQLPYLISRHYCIPPQSWAGSLRRLRQNLWLGYGKVPRYYWGTGLFWMYLKERGVYTVIYLLGVLVSLITLLVTLYSTNIVYFGSWMSIVTGVIIVFSIKKRSVRKALLSCFIQTWVAYSAVRGFMGKPQSPEEYPTDAEIIQIHLAIVSFVEQTSLPQFHP